MANYFARKAGNINATDVWATTPSGTAAAQTFVAGDVLYANSFAITVNVSTDLGSTGEVRNDNTNGATAGGSFTLSNSVTLTANSFAGSAGTACVGFGGGVGTSATLVGNATGGSANGANGANNSFTGTMTITGNATGGSANGANGVQNSSTGTLNLTGNATGGSANGANGVQNSSTGTLNIVGSAFASNNAHGAQNVSTGILNVIRAVGNDWGISSTGMVSVAGVNSSIAGSQTRVEEFEFGLRGQAPVTGAVSTPDLTTNVCIVHRLGTTKKTLIDPSANTGQANEADVRFGTSYALGNRTGTLRVPAAGSVALGVLVDNTSGTAVLTPSAVWDALTSGMTTAGSIGERLKNAATVDSTGQALADALSPN